MLLVSSVTSATSAMLATMASSSMQGTVPFFDFAFSLVLISLQILSLLVPSLVALSFLIS